MSAQGIMRFIVNVFAASAFGVNIVVQCVNAAPITTAQLQSARIQNISGSQSTWGSPLEGRIASPARPNQIVRPGQIVSVIYSASRVTWMAKARAEVPMHGDARVHLWIYPAGVSSEYSIDDGLYIVPRNSKLTPWSKYETPRLASLEDIVTNWWVEFWAWWSAVMIIALWNMARCLINLVAEILAGWRFSIPRMRTGAHARRVQIG
jgi:hypothetical protein